MLEQGKTYLVMGLLDPDSIAYAIGQAIHAAGGNVVYTVQNELLKKRYLDGSKKMSDKEKAGLDFLLCDVSDQHQIKRLFSEVGPVAGIVHSIAYANPRTCLGEEFHTSAIDDILRSYQVSCVSLASVVREALPVMQEGGSIVAMSFETGCAFPLYNWMGVHKSALEGLVRALARRHGRDGIRVNAVSAGPLATTASSRIPGFDALMEMWREKSPLPWDPVRDKQAVADAVVFLLSRQARMVTGQILKVDGGASVTGGKLLDFER